VRWRLALDLGFIPVFIAFIYFALIVEALRQ
jgi:hypothetical protein